MAHDQWSAPGAASTPHPALRDAVFVDLDRTLIPGSSLYLLGRALRARGLLRVRDVAKFALSHLAFRFSGMERARAMRKAEGAALAFVRGQSREELRRLGAEVASERIVPTAYPGMCRLVAQHAATGRTTVLVTAAPADLAEPVAAALGMTAALGTMAEVDGAGRYTGRRGGPVLHGEEKARAVVSFARAKGMDLRRCFAYSDSVSDLPLLDAVGYPCAVNPDRSLRRRAARRSWPVLELRTRHRAALIGSAAAGVTAVTGVVATKPHRLLRRGRPRRRSGVSLPRLSLGTAR